MFFFNFYLWKLGRWWNPIYRFTYFSRWAGKNHELFETDPEKKWCKVIDCKKLRLLVCPNFVKKSIGPNDKTTKALWLQRVGWFLVLRNVGLFLGREVKSCKFGGFVLSKLNSLGRVLTLTWQFLWIPLIVPFRGVEITMKNQIQPLTW